jgi:hypothetical protein
VLDYYLGGQSTDTSTGTEELTEFKESQLMATVCKFFNSLSSLKMAPVLRTVANKQKIIEFNNRWQTLVQE